VDRLLAKARGEEVPEQPPVQSQDIQITVMVVSPLERKPEEVWRKAS
jgi:hypothetical protein